MNVPKMINILKGYDIQNDYELKRILEIMESVIKGDYCLTIADLLVEVRADPPEGVYENE